MTGYSSSLYAAALADIGRPAQLPRSGGWLIERHIPGADARDAMGPYPLFCCEDWSHLGRDLADLAGRIIAVSMVADPFAGVETSRLGAIFPDVCRAYKEHYVVDLAANWRTGVCRHHRRNVRAAARHVEVEWSDRPCSWIDEWAALYARLALRHAVLGVARFSRVSFLCQLQAPGMTALRAACRNRTVGMLLWYRSRDVAYYHLGAFDDEGYERKAAFGLFDAALNRFAADGVRYAALGGGAGWNAQNPDGLTRFKQGWANDRRTAWFCGRVFDRPAYDRLAESTRAAPSGFFPAYRRAEAA